MKPALLILLLFTNVELFAQNAFSIRDYADLPKYEEANKKLGKPSPGQKRVVFMGNSITQFWPAKHPEFFAANGYIGRGISGQVTHQMLLRFRQDVINLQPEVVVILAGTNDIAGNSGKVNLIEIMDNIESMVDLARQNDIQVVLCSILPASQYPWNPGVDPKYLIPKLNEVIRTYAANRDIPYVDYYSAMDDGEGGLKVPDHTSANDLVHPNAAGYSVMESVVKPVIDELLKKEEKSAE